MTSTVTDFHIINLLFELDLDEIIQKVFLHLDPHSLKNCKSVCSEWFEFIQKRLWHSKPAKAKLRKRLVNQWKFSEPLVTEYDQRRPGVNFLVCDDAQMVCGYTRGQARMYDVHTGELTFQVQCNTSPMRIYDGVQLDLGKSVLGSVTDNGTVSVWDRKDGSLLYRAKHHGEHVSVFGIKVADEYILTGAGDGSMCMLECPDGVWKVKHEMLDNKEGITHIDADGKWAVTGTRKSIKLWDLEQQKLVENVKPIKVKVWMLSFTYPHAFVVGGEDWKGVQVWDMVKCVKIRQVEEDGAKFYNIHTNGRFLTVSELNDSWAADGNRMRSVAVYDALDLINTKLETQNLWKKLFEFPTGENYEQNLQINSVLNTTSLVVSHASKISIMNFWKDQLRPSRVFLGEEMLSSDEYETGNEDSDDDAGHDEIDDSNHHDQ